MTFTGWTPWLFDAPGYPGARGQEVFEAYVRANSVLLMPGEAGINKVSYPTRWSGPWHALHWGRRACPVCATDPDRGKGLTWQLPLMLGCGEHGCYLEDEQRVSLSVLTGAPIAARPVPEPVATTERYTHAALTTGRVELPGRTVHAGVWFRLLRSLLDEVSVAPANLPCPRPGHLGAGVGRDRPAGARRPESLAALRTPGPGALGGDLGVGAGRDHRSFGLGDGILPGGAVRVGPIALVDVLLAWRLDGGCEPAVRGDLPVRGQVHRGGGREVHPSRRVRAATRLPLRRRRTRRVPAQRRRPRPSQPDVTGA